ncbi:MAG: cytochrome c biogenesis protein CcdA [Candidatus Lambdaproteobacteria bacterium]|nr:cytochrome c biogenesis protein CcdA [Candidatus Lambdaproteobacteria bacterium]
MDPVGALQVTASGAMGRLVDALPVGYAFGAGMMSAVNPCGFTLLPAYLALFLGAKEQGFRERPLPTRLAGALGVAAVVTLGFTLLFGAIGGLVAAGARFVISAMPWIGAAVGAGLLLLGAWMLAGRHMAADTLLRWGARVSAGQGGGLRGYFLYGITFGACSVSCTLPVFLVVVGSALAAGGFAGVMAQFVSYGLGMGAVVTLLTLAVALLKESVLLRGVRWIVPHLHTATAVFVSAAGLYILYYWLVKGDLLV